MVLVYSDDAKLFWEEPAALHAAHGSDFQSEAFAQAGRAGKYKMDLAVRAAFPRYRNAKRSRRA